MTTKTPKYTPEELLSEALEKSLKGCDYPWEVQEDFTRIINEWVESFEIKSCFLGTHKRQCQCP